jgi:valyl-tRNA synthetase
MSKSLGNVVDPLDVSSEYGSDALRYTLATGNAPGQDINLSIERVTSSRNLTNKIWNAAKFVLFGTKELSDQEFNALAGVEFRSSDDMDQLDLSSRWIVSRLHEHAAPYFLLVFSIGSHAFIYCSSEVSE